MQEIVPRDTFQVELFVAQIVFAAEKEKTKVRLLTWKFMKNFPKKVIICTVDFFLDFCVAAKTCRVKNVSGKNDILHKIVKNCS